MKIFLIGYMGSGKSTVGERLSEKLSRRTVPNFDFIDFDKYVEKETGKSIEEIFDRDGEEKFRMLEHECLKKLLPKENVVISLGGGTPCFHHNIRLINKNGISIYLEMSVDTLVKRLSKARMDEKDGKAKNKRPLIRDLNEADLKYFIGANLEKRKPVYLQATHIIQSDYSTADDLAEKIMKLIQRGN